MIFMWYHLQNFLKSPKIEECYFWSLLGHFSVRYSVPVSTLVPRQFFKMLSHAKIICPLIFRAFHETPKVDKYHENKYLRAKRICRSPIPLICFEIIDFCWDIAVRIRIRSSGHWWPTVIGQSKGPIMITFWSSKRRSEIISVKTKKINHLKSIIVFQLTDDIVFG